MKLFEYEGKELFAEYGIVVSEGVVVGSVDGLKGVELIDPGVKASKTPGSRVLRLPVMVKAQVLSGKRGKRGLIKKVEDSKLLSEQVTELLSQTVGGERVEKVLVEEAVEIERELYVSVTYSTRTRGLVLLVGEGGGRVEDDGEVTELPVKFEVRGEKTMHAFPRGHRVIRDYPEVIDVIDSLIILFLQKDLFLAEINPLVITQDGKVVAVDAKVVTDDAADFRQKWEFEERNMMGRAKTRAEVEAGKIDKDDHRGVVGRVYLDLDGDIGVLAAGGGASLVAMDAMVGYDLAPANYTEFSGNPPMDKIARLTEVVLSKKGLRGAALVGGKANFTDQFETLSGFVEGLAKVKPKYPIVVRRDGPRMEEAKKMLEVAKKKHGWDLWVYDSGTSIIEAVNKLKELVMSK